MARKRPARRPADPMDIARRRAAEREAARSPERWGVDVESLNLPANADVRLTAAAAGKVTRVHRQDVFDSLHARGRLSDTARAAVRRLQDDLAMLHRTTSGVGGYEPRVDCSRDPQGFTDRRRRAGQRVAAVLDRAGLASARLITALCEPDIVLGRVADWRAIVARETGERLPDAQGALVRMACENLAGAYGMVARAPVEGGERPYLR